MYKERDWSEDIGEAVKGAQRNIGRSHNRLNTETQAVGMHVTSKGNVACYDVSCPICQKDATKVTTTTVYHKPNTHESKITEIQRLKEMEDFKYSVARD
jgi:hypothetical protein